MNDRNDSIRDSFLLVHSAQDVFLILYQIYEVISLYFFYNLFIKIIILNPHFITLF